MIYSTWWCWLCWVCRVLGALGLSGSHVRREKSNSKIKNLVDIQIYIMFVRHKPYTAPVVWQQSVALLNNTWPIFTCLPITLGSPIVGQQVTMTVGVEVALSSHLGDAPYCHEPVPFVSSRWCPRLSRAWWHHHARLFSLIRYCRPLSWLVLVRRLRLIFVGSYFPLEAGFLNNVKE
jgi:hypothetical protein